MFRAMFAAFVITFFCFSTFAGAPKKVCNDLKVSQCKKRTDCSWIKKSKKSDRKAYCRVNGKAVSKGKKKAKKKTL